MVYWVTLRFQIDGFFLYISRVWINSSELNFDQLIFIERSIRNDHEL